MPGEGDDIEIHPFQIDRDLAGSLRGIDQHDDAPFAAGLTYCGDILHRPDDVGAMINGHEASVFLEFPNNVIGIDKPVVVKWHIVDFDL